MCSLRKEENWMPPFFRHPAIPPHDGIVEGEDSRKYVEEAPVAYKPIQPVIETQVKAEMISVVARLRPFLTFKV